MTHTPGPWYVGAMTDQLYVINEPPRPGPKDYENTSLQTVAIAKTFAVDGGFKTEEANAHLMAAAPQLKEALEEYLSAKPQCECSDHSGCRMASARVKARAALAAAEGET